LPAVLLGFGALFLGVVASTGEPLIAAFLCGLVVTFAMLFFPEALLWITVLGGLVIAGLMEIYLPGLRMVRWGFAGTSVLLFASSVYRDHFSAQVRGAEEAGRQPALFKLAVAFVVVCTLSSVLNWHGIGQTLFGWKGYFQVWALFFALALTRQTPAFFSRAPAALLAVAFLQLPFAAQQVLFIVPMRGGIPGVVPADIVAGTFGGSVTGGGANSLLALYLISVITVLVSLWRSGALKGRWPLPVAGVLMLPLFFNESKASMVFLMVSFVLIFREDIAKRPLRFMGIAFTLGLLLVGLLYSYILLNDRLANKDPLYFVEHAIEANTAEGQHFGGRELNRLTSLKFWAEQRSRYGAKEFLVGHGLAESRDDSGVLDLATETLASVRYRGMGIGVSSAAGLLWDVGVIGTLVLAAMFLSAFRLAGRLARQTRSAWEQGWFSGLQAVVAMISLSLLHNNFFTFYFEYQVFVMLVLGYLVHVGRLTDKPFRSIPLSW